MRTLLTIVVGVLVLIGVMILSARNVDRMARERAAAPPPPTISAAEAMAHRVQVLLRNDQPDDIERELTFRALLSQRGHRCDRVASALMRSPGTWRVVCTPGYGYTLYYDGADPMVKLTTVVPD